MTDYCGCCGDDYKGDDPCWCARCQPHIERRPVPVWELTYFATRGEPCPFQVGEDR